MTPVARMATVWAALTRRGKISADGAAIHAYVISVREELLIARETADVLGA
jgi:hypothetical protein